MRFTETYTLPKGVALSHPNNGSWFAASPDLVTFSADVLEIPALVNLLRAVANEFEDAYANTLLAPKKREGQ